MDKYSIKEKHFEKGIIVYIEYFVTNKGDEDFDFGESQVGIIGVQGGYLCSTATEVSYANPKGSGSHCYFKIIEPQKEEFVRIAYYLDEDTLKEMEDVYIDTDCGAEYKIKRPLFPIPGLSKETVGKK